MENEAKSVVVIQDACKELNFRVFYWAINGLSLKQADMVTLLVILHQVCTPMGYISTVDNTTMVGVNKRIIEGQLARKKEEYLYNEKLAEIAKLYESNEVAFKIQLFTGSSAKDVALKGAINLKATWVILDRQMKKDEEFFLQKLSCGISRLKRNNRIVCLRGPLDLPVEIQCNSHESYDESLPENPYEDLFSIDVFHKSNTKVDERSQTQRRPHKEEGCSEFTTNRNQKTCQTNSDHNMDETDINGNQMLDQIERDCLDQEQKQSMPHEKERDTKLVINNDLRTGQEIAEKTHNFFFSDQPGKEMIDQTEDDMMGQNEAQTRSISHGQQQNCILENSICSVCKTRRPNNVEWQKEFIYEELEAATDGFSLKNCLSESGHLSTFKGQLEGKLKIVVKQHAITNTQVRKKIMSEIQTIFKARHKNVVMLLGSSTEERLLLTVYEYACNGSLDKYLSSKTNEESCRPLTWSERVRVVIGLARGLQYLHQNNIVHGNIKPSNILLTHDFKPLIGDFGFGKKLEWRKSNKNKNVENSEYIAPEYQEKEKLSTRTDVYSFGVVILELITGRRTSDEILGEKSLVGWAKPLLGGKKYPMLVDPMMRNSYADDQLHWLFEVIEHCLKKNPKDRSSMNVVVSALQGIGETEKSNVAEDFTPAISNSRIDPDKNASQVQVVSTLQGITESKRCCMREELTPAISNSRFVRDSNDSQGPTQEVKQIESSSYGEERRLRLTVENNYYYDKVSQIEEKMLSRSQGEGRSSGKMIVNDQMMDRRVVDQLSEFEEQKSALYGEGISMQCSSHENLQDGHEGEVILNNSKSSSCSICKCKRPNTAWQRNFTYDELLEATEGFSVKNSISENEVGLTFKGLLEGKVKIVVKKYQISRSQEEKIFTEVQLLTNNRHKNVVMLLGSCSDKNQLMIVYEQVCNGSLNHYLSSGSFQSLTWRERMKVAAGTARGLKYLHGNDIIHGSIKSSNILLTHDFEPLIGDFGFGKVKLEPKKFYKDKSARNSAYTAPECLESGKLSIKTDVFSFGVVLLELITGRSATKKLSGGKSLVGWARPLLKGKKYPQLVDPKIRNSYEEEQLRWLVEVTEECLRKNPKDRFSMNMVVSALQGIADTDECCIIQDSSPGNLPHDEPAMTSSQGEMKTDPVSREQDRIDRNSYGEDRSLRSSIKTSQLRQDGEEMQSKTVISNHKIDQINPDQQIQEKYHIKGSFHIEEIGKQEVDKQQNVRKDKKQMEDRYDEDLLNGNECKIILENSRSSVCSICKRTRPNNGWQKKFTYEELQVATEGFSVKNSLSEGEYGPAFRGQIDNKLKIVVKQHQFTSLREEKVFMSEVELLTNARHENVILLLGSCIRESQLLIVYEQACNGSLDYYLSRASGRSLTWRERVEVAIGVSKGLNYLHENSIIHGRIKPSNILLNHEFKPLLGDFGFGKERHELKNFCKDKKLQNGGYTAPECLESGKLSTMADVYSFGAVLLELITGCMITDKIPGQKFLIQWARPLLGGRRYLQLVDPKISSSYDEQELVSLVHVTEKCLRMNPEERLTMNMVVSALPCVINSNDIYVTEDSSSEKSYHVVCTVSDTTGSKGDEESPEVEDLSKEISEERVDNITFSLNNGEKEICQESDSYTTCGESGKETQVKESSSTNICQKWKRFPSYGGARDFFLEGAQEYTVCEEFFSWCNSI